MEVVSERNRRRDLVKKRREYALAGIPEYWIVDPQKETITVLVKKAKEERYTVYGRFPKGTQAASKLLRGFTVDVTEAISQKP
jgi:Uma2 family endonuclease